jgi:hypothetical protein
MEWMQGIVEPLAPWKFGIDLGSALCAFAAGLLWLRGSLVRTPRELSDTANLAMLNGQFGREVAEIARGVARQARLNAVAAAFASATAVLTGVSVLIGIRWG